MTDMQHWSLSQAAAVLIHAASIVPQEMAVLDRIDTLQNKANHNANLRSLIIVMGQYTVTANHKQ